MRGRERKRWYIFGAFVHDADITITDSAPDVEAESMMDKSVAPLIRVDLTALKGIRQ